MRVAHRVSFGRFSRPGSLTPTAWRMAPTTNRLSETEKSSARRCPLRSVRVRAHVRGRMSDQHPPRVLAGLL